MTEFERQFNTIFGGDVAKDDYDTTLLQDTIALANRCGPGYVVIRRQDSNRFTILSEEMMNVLRIPLSDVYHHT